MEEKTFEVKTGKPLKVVGSVTVPIYANTDELVAAETQETIIAMFNNANKVRLMGNERAKHQTGRIGKDKKRAIAFELLFNTDVEGIDNIEEVRNNCITSYDVLQDTLNGAAVQAAVAAYIAADTTEESEVEAPAEE